MAHAHTRCCEETTTKTLAILLWGAQGTPHTCIPHLPLYYPSIHKVVMGGPAGWGQRVGYRLKEPAEALLRTPMDPCLGSDVAINVSIVSFWPWRNK